MCRRDAGFLNLASKILWKSTKVTVNEYSLKSLIFQSSCLFNTQSFCCDHPWWVERQMPVWLQAHYYLLVLSCRSLTGFSAHPCWTYKHLSAMYHGYSTTQVLHSKFFINSIMWGLKHCRINVRVKQWSRKRGICFSSSSLCSSGLIWRTLK